MNHTGIVRRIAGTHLVDVELTHLAAGQVIRSVEVARNISPAPAVGDQVVVAELDSSARYIVVALI